MKVYIS